MNAKVTTKGWLIDITNTVHGMLEQGGVSGRRELWTWDALIDIGCTVKNPTDIINLKDGTKYTGSQYLVLQRRDYLGSGARPNVKVVRKGHIIQ
jgi:hypothetical protein